MTRRDRFAQICLTLGEGENRITITKHTREHCHDANVEKLNCEIVNFSCKRKAIENLSDKSKT